ncbi:hypothetical protein GH714_000379 [Hevea brasiliensis]|uniref:Protein kinase domain-containing protein n=1 Tax=Hevea brasiliensis TaxID=3981 RepID=A0A6A6NAH0_HEVBR|nr:hypothetical protein GH714_000379 [Hevea brasiliensis]
MPMWLWNKRMGMVIDFNTQFSFVINPLNNGAYVNGMDFFMAPEGSKIPAQLKDGCTLSLASDSKQLNSTSNPFVAIEFDTLKNTWDPPYNHVGVDVNSMKSVKSVEWWRNITGGELNEAWISYNSSTKILSVVFTGIVDNVTVEQYFDYALDLILYLPQRDKSNEKKVKEDESFIAQLTKQEFENATGAKMMSYSEVINATNNWKHKLGEGGFSAVYMGVLKSKYIAIKKFKRVSIRGLKYYASEVIITSRLKHEKLIKLIDLEFNPKLVDFGLAWIMHHDAKSQIVEGMTNGYEAPECHQTGKSRKMSNVYNFGVVALEISCGRKAFVQMDDGHHLHLVKWVWDHYERGNLLNAAD